MLAFKEGGQCTGCRICELICSFHHQRAFGFRLSSIKMVAEEGGKKALKLRKDRVAEIPPCDECRGEVTPLCVQYCPNEVLEWKGGDR